MNFDIDPGLPVPIYRQIIDQVRRQVAGGAWGAGDDLPSVRALAQQHAINPMTVSKAYSLLEAEGLLERRRGMGMVVAAVRPRARPAQRLALLEPALQAAALQAAQLGLGMAEALRAFRHCLQQQGMAEHPNPDAD